MIEQLRAGDRPKLKTDVVVIGAGTVGLVTAVTLAKEGLSVVCLESGLASQVEEEHPLNAVVHSKRPYDGAAHGRFRCLGGTSTRWGGALIPFLEGDLDPEQWPIPYQDIVRFLSCVEAQFGLSPGPYTVEELGGFASSDFVPRLAKWPAFGKRNVARLFRCALSHLPSLQVWLNATVTHFEVNDERIIRLTARSLDGGKAVVEADEVIFAAGAIETTRLLLLLDQQNANGIFGPDDQLGRYFSDHLSLIVAHLEARDRTALNRLTGFRFERRGAMRNLRFEIAEASELRKSIPPCFFHIAFETDEKSGFNASRNLFRFVQKRRLPPPSVFFNLAMSAPWLAKAVWWRCVEKRLLYPDTASVQLHLVMEQVPRPENRISLAKGRTDPFGLPLAEIAWDIAEKDHENIDRAVTAFEGVWERSALSSVARIIRRPTRNLSQDLAGSGGVFHPVGSTRVGKTPRSAVVDSNLRPFRLRNTTVLSTSVLPNSGGANPTMMLMLLAFRCIDRLTQDYAR